MGAPSSGGTGSLGHRQHTALSCHPFPACQLSSPCFCLRKRVSLCPSDSLFIISGQKEPWRWGWVEGSLGASPKLRAGSEKAKGSAHHRGTDHCKRKGLLFLLFFCHETILIYCNNCKYREKWRAEEPLLLSLSVDNYNQNASLSYFSVFAFQFFSLVWESNIFTRVCVCLDTSHIYVYIYF